MPPFTVVKIRRFALQLATSLLGGAIFVTAMLVPRCSLLIFVALVPWALLYGRPHARTGLLPGIIGLILAIVGSAHPLARWGPTAPIITAFETALFFGTGMWLLRETSRWWPRVPIVFRFPPIWLAIDWICVKAEFLRLHIFMIPHPLADWPVLIQAADLLGGMALALPIVMVNGALADMALLWRRRRAPLEAAAESAPGARGLVWTAAAVASVWAAIALYGWARIDRSEPVQGPRVALLQPCLPHTLGRPLGVYSEEMYMSVRDVPPGQADIVMWPENSILDFYDRPHRYLEDLAWLAESRGASFLVGAIGRARKDPFRTTNVALLLSPDGKVRNTYEKIDIIPWTEYFPFESLLTRVSPTLNLLHLRLILDALGYFPTGTRGAGATLFPYTWQGQELPFAVVLCSEAAIPQRARAGALLGARFLVNLISEGEVGGLVQLDMLRLCRLRAVENRLPFIRVGNTGITCVIDESGMVRDTLRGAASGALIDEAGILISKIPLPRRQRGSLYKSIGDLVPLACVFLSGAIAAASLVLRWRAGQSRAMIVVMVAVLVAIGCLATAGCRKGGRGGRSDRTATVDFDTALQQGIASFKVGDDAAALHAFERAARSAPDRKDIYPYVAEIFRRRDQTFRGLRFFEKRKEKGETSPAFESYLAYFQMELYQKSAAVETFSRSLQADPDQRPALMWFSALMLDCNRGTDLVPYLTRFLLLHPDDTEVRRVQAEALLNSGQTGKALQLLSDILAFSPRDADALRLKGIAELAHGEIPQAAKLITASKQIDPKDVDTTYQLARIALRMGDLQASRTAIDDLHKLESKEIK